MKEIDLLKSNVEFQGADKKTLTIKSVIKDLNINDVFSGLKLEIEKNNEIKSETILLNDKSNFVLSNDAYINTDKILTDQDKKDIDKNIDGVDNKITTINNTIKNIFESINNLNKKDEELKNDIDGKANAETINEALDAKKILEKLKTVDGVDSGLDADFVRGYLPMSKEGDTCNGPLFLMHEASDDLEAVTKKYVDEKVKTYSDGFFYSSTTLDGNTDTAVNPANKNHNSLIKTSSTTENVVMGSKDVFLLPGNFALTTRIKIPRNKANGDAFRVAVRTKNGRQLLLDTNINISELNSNDEFQNFYHYFEYPSKYYDPAGLFIAFTILKQNIEYTVYFDYFTITPVTIGVYSN